MTAAAEALILENLDLVEIVAMRVARRLPATVEMDELVSLGNIGLCEAAMRFDSDLHASFRGFAMLRIRGSMIDAYRGRNWPRLMDQLPDEWLGHGEWSEDTARRTPERLVDHSSVLEQLIDNEESVVVSIDAVRARRTLNSTEGEVMDLHVRGDSLMAIGKQHKRSGAWACYTLQKAKAKMRLELLGVEREAA